MKHWPTRSDRARHEFTAGLVGDCARMLQAVINNRMDNLQNIRIDLLTSLVSCLREFELLKALRFRTNRSLSLVRSAIQGCSLKTLRSKGAWFLSDLVTINVSLLAER